ncbi:MAG TPA: TIGR03619 family F420-dependent LLM class oxidoreductase [Alphaproteobacteria bacterium]|nr:TIGR03619 family F420-dependent LLM class oxidoreductase [Alphaproteobacteria bacterium]
MKFWQVIALTDMEQLPALCRKAEELGFEGVALADHLVTFESQYQPYDYHTDQVVPWYPHTHFVDPWVEIGALSQIVKTLKFMTTVYILPMRDPFSVAKSLATVARLSDNRVILGAGVGWQEAEFGLVDRSFKDRGKRADEMLDLLPKLMSGEMVEYHGKFFDFPRLQMSPGVTKPMPIFIGGKSPAAYRRAARQDGWIGSQHTLEELTEISAALKQARREIGREGAPFEFHVNLYDYGADALKRAEDLGATAIHKMAWLDETFRAGRTPLDEKLRDMEAFAEKYMR